MSACIVIAVLFGIEIFHKLFTPEMMPDQRSYTWLWLCTGYAAIGYPVQLWTTKVPYCGTYVPMELSFSGTLVLLERNFRNIRSRGTKVPGTFKYELVPSIRVQATVSKKGKEGKGNGFI